MRKNARAALKSWWGDRPNKRAKSIWSDGENLWSYDTCLVTWLVSGWPEDDPSTEERYEAVIINRSRYSVTTSAHQTAIHASLSQRLGAANVIVVEDLDRGVGPDELRRAAEELQGAQ